MAPSDEIPVPEFVLRGSGSPVTALTFIEDIGRKPCLLAGNQNGEVMTWDLRSRRVICMCRAHTDQSVLWIYQRSPGKVLTMGRDGFINIWDSTGPEWRKTDSIKTASQGFCPCVYIDLEDREVIAMPTEKLAQVNLVDMATKQNIKTLMPKAGEKAYGMCMDLKALTLDNGKQLLLVGYENGGVSLWDLQTGSELSHLSCHGDSVMSLDWCPVANKGISASVDNKVSCWRIDEHHTLTKLSEIELTNPGVNCVCYRPDAKIFATGGWDARARIFSVKKGTPLAVLSYHKESIQCLTFSHENQLALGSKDGNISIWNLYN